MDAPAHLNFHDLIQAAQNRSSWKMHSERKFGRNGRAKNTKKKRAQLKGQQTSYKVGKWVGRGAGAVWVGTAPAPKTITPIILSPKAPTFTPRILTKLATPPATQNTAQPAKKVQTLIPLTWRQRSATQPKADAKNNKIQTAVRKKKSKPPSLTDAQRAAWAHAHYIINHGTANDAARLLAHQKTARNIPEEALSKIRRMAAMRVPSWSQAKVEVFSSSCSESSASSIDEHSSAITHTLNCTTAPTTQHNDKPTATANIPEEALNKIRRKAAMSVPSWAQAKAEVFSSSCSESS